VHALERRLGAETYAADRPSFGTRMLGSAPPPARIIGLVNVAAGGVVVAENAAVAPPAISSAAVTAVAMEAERRAIVASQRSTS